MSYPWVINGFWPHWRGRGELIKMSISGLGKQFSIFHKVSRLTLINWGCQNWYLLSSERWAGPEAEPVSSTCWLLCRLQGEADLLRAPTAHDRGLTIYRWGERAQRGCWLRTGHVGNVARVKPRSVWRKVINRVVYSPGRRRQPTRSWINRVEEWDPRAGKNLRKLSASGKCKTLQPRINVKRAVGSLKVCKVLTTFFQPAQAFALNGFSASWTHVLGQVVLQRPDETIPWIAAA